MKILAVMILLLIGMPAFALDQDDFYLSPGIHFGYGFGNGFFVGGQLTLGYYPLHIGLSMPIPGLSVGGRKYFGADEKLMLYSDIQCGIAFGTVGTGFGYAATKSADGNTWNHAYRGKLWIGLAGLLTYDFYKSQLQGINHNVGLMGVRPFGKPVHYGT